MSYKLKWEKLLSSERLRRSGNASNDRNAFESDYGRVIFSPAIRRMHDKTQVFTLSDDDNIHTRLTHSQEVMSIGYTFGIKLVNEIFNANNINLNIEDFKFINKDESLLRSDLLRTIPLMLQTVCLFHDIGNTPFGHFGEDSISNYFKDYFKDSTLIDKEKAIDFTQYDGNAQGLRVLTKLQILDDNKGLNLTSAVLATYLKYPNKSEKIKGEEIAIKKHGVFFSEYEHFDKIMDNCGLKLDKSYVRHPLCFLMEAADTIAYRTMDVEDGFNKDLYGLDYILKCYKKRLSKNTNTKDNLINDLDKNISYIESLSISENSKMVRLRIALIDYLVSRAFSTFIENYALIMNGTYNKELLDDDVFEIEGILGDICKDKIFDYSEVNTLEVTGYSVIKGLLDFYINAIINKENGLEKKAYNLISKSTINTAILEDKIFKGELKENEKYDISEFRFEDFQKLDDYYKLRVIIDFISGMTDKYALKHYQIISGHKLK